MTPYGWAWIVIAIGTPLALFALYRATRGSRAPRARVAVLVLLGVLLVLPAPVPGYPDYYAPAFLVFLFEWWFQQPGEPRTAGLILAAGAVATLALILLLAIRRRRDRGDSAAS